MDFVNLYVETEYSLLESPSKIEDLVSKAKEYGYNALGITDLNNMSGVIKFYKECKKNNIKPIIGLNANVTSSFYNSLLMFAKNEQGYRNLLSIASYCKIEKSGVNLEYLKKHSFGIIAIIPSDENEIVKLLKEKSLEKAKNLVNEYKDAFDDLYLGIDLQTEEMKINIDEYINFAKYVNIPPVAINKTVYINKEDFDVYQTLRCIDLSLNNYPYTEKETAMSLLNMKEITYLFSEYPLLIENTIKIANQCNVEIEFGKYKLPSFLSEIQDTKQYLIDLCKYGLNKRLKGKQVDVEKYKQRLLHELNIIVKMGFIDYFLVVYDFIKYSKKSGILVGPGRGSAPGSLVAYVLGITDIDPIKYDLLFERFLNPERVSMPDIDTDFPDNKRDEVIKYVGTKYGKMKIAHITTFGTFGVRLALRDVARVMKISDVYLNEVLKYVPSVGKMSEIINESVGLRRLIDENPQIQKLTTIVMKLEGLPRHSSTHAAGIIMTKEDLVNYTPLQPGINGLFQTQFEASDLELLGLVKMDFLGIRNLTIIDDVIKSIQEKENPNFDLSKIPYDDANTYKMIASGETDGIFQLESSGMRNVLGMLKTSEFDDIVSANALFRPGPMEMIPSFVKRKFHQEPVTYLHSDLKEILEPTYGIIVFQEQIMLIAQKFAGYSLGEADILRRAVSKKKADVLEDERTKFVENAVSRGYNEKVSNEIYDYIVKFANYGFNKSHAVAYSTIAYQMAYLKRNYYKYFMVVLMTNSIGNTNLIKSYITDCNKKGIKVHIPSINISTESFSLYDKDIYYPLIGIQNVGSVTLSSLLDERNQNGPYQSYQDFVGRTSGIINKRIAESLIHAGALDEFNIPRKQMVMEYENCNDLFSYSDLLSGKIVEKKYSDEEYTFEEISILESEALGFNLKYSIFRRYDDFKRKYNIVDLANLKANSKVNILFVIKNIKQIKTKKNDDMAFLEIYDDSNIVDCVLFPNKYQEYKDTLETKKVYTGSGKVEERNSKLQIILDKIYIAK